MAEPARVIDIEESSVTKADSLVVKSAAKLEEIQSQIQDIVTVDKEKGSILVAVATADQFELVKTVKKLVEDERKVVETEHEDLVSDAHALHKKLVAKRDAALRPYDNLKAALVVGANTYLREEKKKADEKAAELREAARLAEEARLLAEAETLEQEGRPEEANEILSAPITYVAPVPASTLPQYSKKSFTAETVCKARVTDKMKFLSNVPASTLLEMLTKQAWDGIENGLNRKAKALGKAFSMPGTELYES